MGHLPQKIRDQVRRRAEYCCEYCLIPEKYHPSARLHVDHIFSKKHGGQTELSNLALSCPECNRKKGANIASRKHPHTDFIPLFNPRIHEWNQHFELNWAIIRPGTEVGEMTVKILGLNEDVRIAFREYLMLLGVYPRSSK